MKTIKKAITVAAITAFGLSLMSCSSNTPADGTSDPTTTTGGESTSFISAEDIGRFKDSLPDYIIEKGEINFHVQQPNPPMEYADLNTDELLGVDPDIIKSLGQLWDIPVKFTRVKEFSELIPAIQTERTDAIISAVLDKKSRQEVVDLLAYFQTGSQWVVAAGSSTKTLEDLCGQSVSTGAGTNYLEQIDTVSQEVCVSKGLEPINTLTTVSIPEQMMMITQGRAVANLQGVESAGYLQTTEAGKWELLSEPFETARYAVVLSKNKPELTAAFKEALDYMLESGAMAEILAKWNVSSAIIPETQLNAAVEG